MLDENRRSAVGMSITLSSQLMSAGLAVLAIGGGLAAFAFGNREVGLGFFIFAILTFLAFVFSVYLGGKGIIASGSAGYRGYWTFAAGKRFFNAQAIACFIGLICFVITVFLFGKPRQEHVSEGQGIPGIDRALGRLDRRLGALLDENEATERELRSFSASVEGIAVRLEELQTGLQEVAASARGQVTQVREIESDLTAPRPDAEALQEEKAVPAASSAQT